MICEPYNRFQCLSFSGRRSGSALKALEMTVIGSIKRPALLLKRFSLDKISRIEASPCSSAARLGRPFPAFAM
jgi:hypothetical protein